MKIFLNNKIKLIILLLLIALALLAIKLFSVSLLKVLETDPPNAQEKVNFNKVIKITFNRNVSENEISISSSPAFIFNTKVSNQVLEIQPTELLTPDTDYNIELTSKKNSKFYFVFNFKTNTETIPSPTGQSYLEEQKKIYEELDRLTYQEAPLFDYVPYVTENFIIDYIKPLVLQVRLKKDTPTIRKEALDWIKGKGAAETHKVEWKLIK